MENVTLVPRIVTAATPLPLFTTGGASAEGAIVVTKVWAAAPSGESRRTSSPRANPLVFITSSLLSSEKLSVKVRFLQFRYAEWRRQEQRSALWFLGVLLVGLADSGSNCGADGDAHGCADSRAN